MKLIFLISFFCIAFAAANDKRFTNSSNNGKTNPLLWMILNQISGLDTKISKLQDKDDQINKEISELKLKQKETDNNAGKIKSIKSEISEIRKFQNHKSSSGNDKAISKIKAEVRNLQNKHSNDNERTKQILKLKGDVKDLQAKYMLDEKREKQLQEVNKRLKVLQNEVDKLQQQVKKPCESGWTLFGKHCYLFELSKVSWHAAKKECERRLSHLVKIETSVENSFLTSMVTGYGGYKNFWIGLNDLTREGWYTWISDYSAVTYTDWMSGNPDNHHGVEDCCEIRGSNWNDVDCSVSYSFICEKNAD